MVPRQAAFDDLHDEVLREILIRVAGPPDGAADIVRAFSVCKAFQMFDQDRDVLRAVVFDKLAVSRRLEPMPVDELLERCQLSENSISDRPLLYCCPPASFFRQYEPFQQVAGLITKCAQAGHPDAQLILAKIIMVSTSALMIEMEEIGNSEGLVEDEITQKQAKLSSFLAHFTADETNTTAEIVCPGKLFHFNLVRYFLSQASHTELKDMRVHLRDFMRYFIDRKTNEETICLRRFLSLLDKLSKATIMLVQHPQIFSLIWMWNDVCNEGLKALRTLKAKKQHIEALEKFRLPRTNYFEGDGGGLMKHFETVETLIMQGVEEAPVLGNAAYEHDKVRQIASVFKYTTSNYIKLVESIQGLQAKLVAEFDAIVSD